MTRIIGSSKLAELDLNGKEIPDPMQLRLPLGFKRPETLAEQIQRLVRGEVSRRAAAQGFETFEEADDFDVPDDPPDPATPFEEHFDPVLGRGVTPEEFRRNEERIKREMIAKQLAAYEAADRHAAAAAPRPVRGGPRRSQVAEAPEGASAPPKAPSEAPKA